MTDRHTHTHTHTLSLSLSPSLSLSHTHTHTQCSYRIIVQNYEVKETKNKTRGIIKESVNTDISI